MHSLDSPEAPPAAIADSNSNGSEGIAQIQLNELSLHHKEGRSIVHPATGLGWAVLGFPGGWESISAHNFAIPMNIVLLP